MKKFELLTVLGRVMENNGFDNELIKGLGLEYTATMKDTMNTELVRDEKETMDLISGLSSKDPKHVNYWIGVAIKTLAMTSK